MEKLERYVVEPGSDRLLITLNQKKNAAVNIALALAVSAFAIYRIVAAAEVSSFLYVLAGIGFIWLLIALRAYSSKRYYELKSQAIEYHSSGRSEPEKLARSDLSHILLHKIIRPSGRKKRKVPFPWRVKVLDNEGGEFSGEFKFQNKPPAQKMASAIAEFYNLEIRHSES